MPITIKSTGMKYKNPSTGEYQGVDMLEEMTVKDAVVAPYSPTSPYAVGEHCLFGGAMYRCTTAIGDGGETWNPSHWTAKTVAEELEDIDDDVSTINATIGSTSMGTTATTVKGGVAELNTAIASIEWTPTATSTLLDFILTNCDRTTLPFSFQKVGTQTISDIPSEIASAELNVLVYGHGDRIIVQLSHYTPYVSAFYQRIIYQNAWRYSEWTKFESLINAPTLQYSDLTIYTGFTREGGGYYRFGRLVSLNIALTNSSNATINLSGKAVVNGLPPASNDYGNNRQVGAVTVGGVGVSAIAPTSFSLVTYTDRAMVYGDHTIAVNIPAGVTFSISAVYIANK